MNTSLLMHQQQQQQHQQQQQQQQQQQTSQSQSQQNGTARDSNSSRSAGSAITIDEQRGNGRSNRASSCSPASSPSQHNSAVSPVTSLNHSMMAQMQQQQQQHHQLSPPPHVGGIPPPNGMSAGLQPRMPHGLPPHSLGLLNSLQMMHHASPLELMAAAHHHVPPRSYNSPPPISTSDPSANECKLVEYRQQKVAAFIISGETMLCLPQAFELFLKHLVGGLHTVYTKLKRLDIVPLVCNVEQVRILRGLGAIQPGVNRCKLLSCKDFDVLYRDCTTARCLSIKPPESNSLQFRSSRPGRPPKRGPVGLSLPPSHLSQHPQLKKHRLDNGDYAYENGHLSDMNRMDKSPLLSNGYNAPPINHIAFMQMNHHPGRSLMSPGMPPHGMHGIPDSQMLKAVAQSGMSAVSMDAFARSYAGIVKHLERMREENADERQHMNSCMPGNGNNMLEQKSRHISSRNCSPQRQSPVLNLSKSGGNTDNGSNCDERSERSDSHTPVRSVHESSLDVGNRIIGVDDDEENLSDENASDAEDCHEKDEEDVSESERDNLSSSPQHAVGERMLADRDSAGGLHQSPVSSHSAAAVAALHHQRALSYSTIAAAAAAANGAAGNGGVSVNGPLTPNGALLAATNCDATAAAALASGLALGPLGMDPHGGQASSTETLLRNIQKLLKVAADNARQQERQISFEKAELKMDALREREEKIALERQLTDERKLRVLYQKRYRRERKMRLRYEQKHDNNNGNEKTSCNSNSNVSPSYKDESHGDETEQQNQNIKNNNGSNENLRKIEQENMSKLNEKPIKSPNSPNDGNQSQQQQSQSSQNRHIRLRSESPNYKREPKFEHRNEGRRSADRLHADSDNEQDLAECADEGTRNSGRTATESNLAAAAAAAAAAAGGGKAPWNYSSIDLMPTGAFWQHYSESLAQEIELERKARSANSERDVKSPLTERQPSYYKNSVLFGSVN